MEVVPRLDDGHGSQSDRETSPQEAQGHSQVTKLGLCGPCEACRCQGCLVEQPHRGAGLGAGELLGCEARHSPILSSLT